MHYISFSVNDVSEARFVGKLSRKFSLYMFDVEEQQNNFVK